MTQAVFDTSAILPGFTPHPCSDAAEAAMRRYDPLLLTFVQAEFANALRNLVKAKRMMPATAMDLLDLLITRFEFEAPDVFVREALELAVVHNHAVYDCLYVAAARTRGVPLITADRKLTRKFSTISGLIIIDLFELPDPLP